MICLCYNQADYVLEALQSVDCQSYPNIEFIIADDASTDNSPVLIHQFAKGLPQVKLLLNTQNQGNCRTFNQALKLASGKYVIDLATDDIMMPERVAKQVQAFEALDDTFGVVFTNAALINEDGHSVRTFYPIDSQGKAVKKPPSGYLYERLVQDVLISAPTMMMRRSMLEELGGYDASLSYEDFDFWIRSARNHQYFYLDEVLTKKRLSKHSLSTKFYLKHNPLLESSFVVCQKIQGLNRTSSEQRALAIRLQYFIRQSWFMHQFELAAKFGELLKQTQKPDTISAIILIMCKLQIPIHWFYRLYHQCIA